MRKKMRLKIFTGIVGLLTAASMLTGFQPVMAEDSSAVNTADIITVEFEKYASNEANAAAGFTVAGDWAQILTDKTQEDDYRNFNVTFNAAASGYYTLDVIAACYVPGTSVWLSNVNYSINNGESSDLNTGNRLMGRLDSSGTFMRTDFAKTESVYLNAGENTMTFSCKERSQDGNKIAAALDKAVFTPKNVIPSNGIVELENYATDNGTATQWQTTASNSQITKTGDKNKTEELFTVKLNVDEDASYSLGVAAGCSSYLEWLSPLSVSVNGGAYESLAGYNRTDYSKDVTTFGTALFTRPDAISLHKGENTIIIKASARAAGGVYYSLDYLNLKCLNTIRELAENGRIEAEDYVTEWGAVKRTQESPSTGISAVKQIADATEDEVSVTVKVAEEGDYAVAVRAGCAAWAEWLSPLSISFNGSAYEDLGGYEKSGIIKDSSDGLRCARMTRQTTLHLQSGENTISLKAGARTAGGVFYSVDYIDLIKVQNADSISSIPESGRIEMEDYAEQVGMSVNKLDVASNGASAAVKNAALKSDTVSLAFMSDEKKTVNFRMGIASQAWAVWLSPVYIQLNGGETEDPASYTRLAIQGGNDGFRNADMLRTTPIEINKGLNIISFSVKPRSAAYNEGIYYGIDYIDFTKANAELQSPELVMQTEFKVGDTAEISIMDGAEFVTADKVYQITYKSSNEAVAEVDGNGMITAVSPGTSEITVAIRANVNSEEVVLKQNITVEGEEQMVSIGEIRNDNGTVSFNVKSIVDLDSAEVYVAGYDNTGVLVSVKKHNITNLAAGKTEAVSEILGNHQNIQAIKIYVWMDMYPLISGVEVK